MEPYTYTPLPPGHIRLVTLTLSPASTLSATLTIVPFNEDDPQTYTALSYVWGPPTFSYPLETNNSSVLYITPTLSSALHSIIHHSPPGTPLWIDQICINQADNAERSVQVKLMNTLYNRAARVIAYLGPSVPSTAMAVSMVERVGKIARDKVGDMFLWDSEQYHPEELKTVEEVSDERSAELGVPFTDVEAWDAFSEFYDREWYERVWIVQEILPARNAVVICGSFSVGWELVKHAAVWYRYKAGRVSARHKRKVDGIGLTCGLDLSWNLRMGTEYLKELMGQKTNPTYKWELLRLLRTFRGRKATDPRDKVYALLGLSAGGWDVPKGWVDYDKDVKRVFAETARMLLKSGVGNAKLDVLLDARPTTCSCEGCPVEPDWPSWVPDWRRHFGEGCEWGVGRSYAEWHQEYECGKYEPEEEPKDLFALRTEGVILGWVTYRSPYSHLQEIVMDGHMRETRNVCVDLVSEYPTGEDVDIAVAMTMVGGRLPEPLKEKGTSVEVYAEKYLDFLDVLMMPWNSDEEERVRYEAWLPYEKLGLDNEWLQAVLQAYCERRLFVLDKGYVGLGNHHMEEGDVIAKLAGLSVPCVLRPGVEPNEYEFVG
ncbi:Heterokaryon incompatibility protein 6, OR allele [Madurella mycetomatis]|uniref:Heterokaryon incompatibility protein 6, OR allele n=1 Tax=Madurella mycetomatis TaxID=100816 RepID=A0A175WB06_9PEZI|nr:Heterokaryon incompatibility protein 6, OR allele [Madurella mycetomatis]